MQRAAPTERRRLDQIEADIAAAERQIADVEERIIVALRRDDDISEAEKKVEATQRMLESMRAQRRQLMRNPRA
jgi:septal ring factor EnvC (AmiA/AmiB activator)